MNASVNCYFVLKGGHNLFNDTISMPIIPSTNDLEKSFNFYLSRLADVILCFKISSAVKLSHFLDRQII